MFLSSHHRLEQTILKHIVQKKKKVQVNSTQTTDQK